MPIKTTLFLAGFVICGLVGLKRPIWALVGYMGVYLLAPENVWWGKVIAHWRIRYSFIMGACLGVGMILNWRRLEIGGRLLLPVERWLIAFLAWMFVTHVALGPEPTEEVTAGMTKMFKVVVFLLMLSHVVTTRRGFTIVAWVLIAAGFLFGMRAISAPPGMFATGRLDAMGGPDFTGANPFALQLAVALIFTAVVFLRSGWKVRAALTFVSAVVVNAIIMARGRGAFLAMVVAGIAAAIFAPRRSRKAVVIVLLLGAVGFVRLTDRKYRDRIATIVEKREKAGESVASRLDIWAASFEMFKDHPMGVGRGKFRMVIPAYSPGGVALDAHNTFIRCLCELGVVGAVLFAALLVSVLRIIMRARRLSTAGEEGMAVAMCGWGLLVALTTYLAGGMFSTMLYVEGMWWLVGLTACLGRIMENMEQEQGGPAESPRPAGAVARRGRRKPAGKQRATGR